MKKPELDSQSFYINIVGGYYYGAAYEKLRVGDKVRLIKEPDNKFDKHAIKVVNAKGEQVGHVSNSYKTIRESCLRATEIQNLFDQEIEGMVYADAGEVHSCRVIVNPSNQNFLNLLRM